MFASNYMYVMFSYLFVFAMVSLYREGEPIVDFAKIPAVL
jgi:hypothetical protein